MEVILLIAVIVLLLVNLGLSLRKSTGGFSEVKSKLDNFDWNLKEMGTTLKQEISHNREELSKSSKENREELGNSLKNFSDSNVQTLTKITQLTNESLGKMTQTIENKLKTIQEDNSQQLEKMRLTVDEKLHKTLEQRLGESFKLVSERLEQVHKGLGEMQVLATGVGDLKKVLSNVKTRGIFGEMQLGNILEEILAPEQYGKNVVTKKESKELVEFAVKLPGKEDAGQVVYLPVDSKFPLESYYALMDAYEKGDLLAIEESSKLLGNSIKKCARDIRDKYIDVPNTTDFAIMFLPFEGLYAEVLRNAGLFDTVRREYKVAITGPSTFSAFLNSLQMGFRTLVIEKRSSEVWKTLGAVKTEFEKFGEVLERAQEKIKSAGEEIESLAGVRTRQIQRKLKEVENIPAVESTALLEEGTAEEETPVPQV